MLGQKTKPRFGMPIVGPWYNEKPKNDYLYNGMEYNTDLGLNWSDYGARFYDPQIGRWMSVDPAAELLPSYSSYAYCFNNPLRYIDPDGKYPNEFKKEYWEYKLVDQERGIHQTTYKITTESYNYDKNRGKRTIKTITETVVSQIDREGNVKTISNTEEIKVFFYNTKMLTMKEWGRLLPATTSLYFVEDKENRFYFERNLKDINPRAQVFIDRVSLSVKSDPNFNPFNDPESINNLEFALIGSNILKRLVTGSGLSKFSPFGAAITFFGYPIKNNIRSDMDYSGWKYKLIENNGKIELHRDDRLRLGW